MFFKSLLPAIIWAVIIFVLSVAPTKSLDMGSIKIPYLDKIAHSAFYAIWSFLLMVGFRKQYRNIIVRSNAVGVALITILMYGLLIESVQGIFTADRFFELADVIANLVGGIVGILILRLYNRLIV